MRGARAERRSRQRLDPAAQAQHGACCACCAGRVPARITTLSPLRGGQGAVQHQDCLRCVERSVGRAAAGGDFTRPSTAEAI